MFGLHADDDRSNFLATRQPACTNAGSVDAPDPDRALAEQVLAYYRDNPRVVFGLRWLYKSVDYDEPLENWVETLSFTLSALLDSHENDLYGVLLLCREKSPSGNRSLPSIDQVKGNFGFGENLEFPLFLLNSHIRYQTEAAARWLTGSEPEPELDNGHCWFQIHRYTGTVAIIKMIGSQLQVVAPDLLEKFAYPGQRRGGGGGEQKEGSGRGKAIRVELG